MKKILCMALMLVPSMGFAATGSDLLTKELSKIAVAEFRDYNDAKLIQLIYTGAKATANVSVSSAVMTLAAPTGTTIYTLDTTYAAYDTLGELCDYLDRQDDMKCNMLGGKRDDASTLIYDAVTTQSILGPSGYSLAIGTSAVSGDTGSYTNRIGITPATGKGVLLKYCTVNLNSSTSDLDGLIIYGKQKKYAATADGVTRNDTTKVISGIKILDDTDTNVGNLYNGYFIEFAKDEHVVISAGSGTTAQAAGNFLVCYWDEK